MPVGGATLRRFPAVTPVPLLAGTVVGLGLILGWRGVDLPAQLYRVANFRAHGLAPWDGQWFGGQWTLSYSVLFPPLAAAVGLGVVTVGAAAGAALAFDRLAVAQLGSGGRPASVVFAVGTAVQSAIGQLPFLAGEALGLAAVWAACRNRWTAAVVLALGASLTSPLAGVFLIMGVAAWLLSCWSAAGRTGKRVRATSVMVAAAAPLSALALLFPGQGRMPYPLTDYLWEMAVAAGLGVLAGRQHRTIRALAVMFMAVATLAFLVPSPLGGNVGRMEDVLALPLAVAVLWPRPRLARLVLLPVAGVPLVLSQWAPAWGAMTTNNGQPSTHAAYFAPLLAALHGVAEGGRAGRVEVVPTEFHWEAVYVAPVMPLARGWERQADEADNPVFYGSAGRLTASAYRAWLLDNGVRFVALADAPLDFSGRAEARLIDGGRATGAGLDLVWRAAHWRLFEVTGGTGVVAPPARLVSEDGDRVVVTTPRPGPVLVRMRDNANWELAVGAGCLEASPGDGPWIRVLAPGPERFTLRLSLFPGRDRCRAAGS